MLFCVFLLVKNWSDWVVEQTAKHGLNLGEDGVSRPGRIVFIFKTWHFWVGELGHGTAR